MDYAMQEKLTSIEQKLDDKLCNQWLTTREASKYAAVSIRTINRHIHLGTLKVSQRLGKNLFKRIWLDQWLEEGR
mgnify:CR=1 FL=1|tara:strand:+ start:1998 stop:2222 length:225 start_codon:yes stop_codon:yes gene_type:complete